MNQHDIALSNLLAASGLPGAEDLDIPACLTQLDEWALIVAAGTERFRPRFRPNPSCPTDAHYRCYMLVKVLRDEFGLKHHLLPDDPNWSGWSARRSDGCIGFDDSSIAFMHGLLGPKRLGSCTSLPVLFTAVGRRLGYPLKLALAVEHVLFRWEEGSPGQSFNIEATGHCISCDPDSHYIDALRPWTEYEKTYFLRSLTTEQEVALFCALRAWCLLEHGHLRPASFLIAKACVLDKDNPDYPRWLSFAEHLMRERAKCERGGRRAEGPAPIWRSDEVGGVLLVGPGTPPHIQEPLPQSNQKFAAKMII